MPGEQQEHDRTVHPELVAEQQVVLQEMERLFSHKQPERCSFCGVRVEDRREHERSEHATEFARATALAERLKELDRHWHVSR